MRTRVDFCKEDQATKGKICQVKDKNAQPRAEDRMPDLSWADEGGGGGGRSLSEPLVDEENTNPFASSEKGSEKSAPAPAWDDEEKPPKKGHVYLLCCDTRRASIIVNALFLFVLFVGFVVAATPKTGLTLGATSWVTLIFSIMVSAMSIYGAVKFLPIWVGFTVLWDLYLLTYGITATATGLPSIDWSHEQTGAKSDSIAFAAISIVWQILMIYAEGALLVDMERGFMKSETYKGREEYSVCCKQ